MAPWFRGAWGEEGPWGQPPAAAAATGGTTTRRSSPSSSPPSWTTPLRYGACRPSCPSFPLSWVSCLMRWWWWWCGGAADSRRAGGALPWPQRLPLPRPPPVSTPIYLSNSSISSLFQEDCTVPSRMGQLVVIKLKFVQCPEITEEIWTEFCLILSTYNMVTVRSD